MLYDGRVMSISYRIEMQLNKKLSYGNWLQKLDDIPKPQNRL